MAKTLEFSYNGIDYTLEYTKRTVEQMENSGFNLSELRDKPMTVLPSLFRGAFLAHHRYVKQGVIDDIFALMPNKGELIGKLAEMYNDPIAQMMDEPDEEQGKNSLTWTANW